MVSDLLRHGGLLSWGETAVLEMRLRMLGPVGGTHSLRSVCVISGVQKGQPTSLENCEL